MFIHRHTLEALGRLCCLAAALPALLLPGCAPIGVRQLAPYQPITVTPLDPVVSGAAPPMTPLDRAAPVAPPAVAMAPGGPEAIAAAPLGPEPLALAQLPRQQCNTNNAAAAAAAQPNATVPVAPPPVTAPPKKPCGPNGNGNNCCPWFHHCDPPANVPKFRPGVTIAPRELIAPVNSEVILTAAVANNKGTLIAGDPVQWTLAQGGVGEFIELGPRDMLFHPPKKVDSHYALGRTSKSYFRITRGTVDTTDDALVLRGQAWTSVTSPMEGVSYVTAYAPDEENWERRKDTAKIYWVDAQWEFPPPAINPAGQPHVFTTVLTRATDQTPIEKWIVRYEVLDGPPAGFGPTASPLIDVETDMYGRAAVELVQRTPAEGTNNIQIRVIRPANPAKGENKPLTLGAGITTKTWTSTKSPIAITVRGPAEVQLEQSAPYTITVMNPADSGVNANNIVLQNRLPTQLSLLQAVPAATGQNGNALEWRLGALSPGQSRTIQIETRVNQAGTFTNCAQVAADGVAMAESCATTTVVGSQLSVSITDIGQIAVGQQATFPITVINRGMAPATGLSIVNTFDPGFTHGADPTGSGRIARNIDDIPGGASRQVAVTFNVVQPGRICQQVELISANGAKASAQLCSNAIASAPAPLPPQLSISHTVDKSEAMLDDLVLYTIVVRNSGQAPVENVRVVSPADSQFLRATQTAPGDFRFYDGNDVDLNYTVRTMQPGEEVSLIVQRQCTRTTGRACMLAAVSAQGIAAQTQEACVRIVEPPRVNMSIQGLNNPVTVGQIAEYRLTVSNTGTTVAQNVRVEFTIPPEMQSAGEGLGNPTQPREVNGIISFAPLAELLPGRNVVYQIKLRAVREAPRDAPAVVEARVYPRDNVTEPYTGTARTEILRAR